MSDDENWDDEFAIPTSPRKLSLSSSTQDTNKRPLFSHTGGDVGDGEEDWSNDFEPDSSVTPQKKILGIKADPNAKEEDWDDDFDFNSDGGGGMDVREDVGRTEGGGKSVL
jgi:hypothetical protein